MPYYQYDEITEIRLRSNPLEVLKIEQAEEEMFNIMLLRNENRLIDLLDLFYPSRYRKQNGRTIFFPSLPIKWRKQTLELLQKEMLDRKFPIGLTKNVELQLSLNELLIKKSMDVMTNAGFHRIYSYAVADYDSNGWAIIEPSNVLSLTVDTRFFVEFLIQHQLFPFELLNFKIVYQFFLEWNQKCLDRLRTDTKDKESWFLIDSVSLLSRFYVLKQWVSDQHVIMGFGSYLSFKSQPLRWGHEDQDNMIESCKIIRSRGRIDSGNFPNEIIEMGSKWNDILEKIQVAMKFRKIAHTGGEFVNKPNIKVDKILLMKWLKLEENESLFSSLQNTSQNKGKKQDQEKRLTKVIDIIKLIAKNNQISLDSDCYPGTKNEFCTLIKMLDSYFHTLTSATLSDYFSSLGIKFKRGVKKGKCSILLLLQKAITQHVEGNRGKN